MSNAHHSPFETMEYLPNDIWYQIISYLDVNAICNLCRTNDIFYQLCGNDVVWKGFMKEIFPSRTEQWKDKEERRYSSWKVIFQKLYLSSSQALFDLRPYDKSACDRYWEEVEKTIRENITPKGLTWGLAKQIHIFDGSKKLSILCQFKDELMSLAEIQEYIDTYLFGLIHSFACVQYTKNYPLE